MAAAGTNNAFIVTYHTWFSALASSDKLIMHIMRGGQVISGHRADHCWEIWAVLRWCFVIEIRN
jgi:hypothetical protein